MHALFIITLICLLVYLTIYSTKLRYVRPFCYVLKSWRLYISSKLEIDFVIDRERNYGLGWVYHRRTHYRKDDNAYRFFKEHTFYFYKVHVIVKIYE